MKIRKLRAKLGMTQPTLAAKCNLLGLNLSRETLAKIETRWISDAELLCLARALKVDVSQLLQEKSYSSKALREFLMAG